MSKTPTCLICHISYFIPKSASEWLINTQDDSLCSHLASILNELLEFVELDTAKELKNLQRSES